MTIKLSLCIPTYNRACFLGETIQSILSQASEEIEIVISDNASSDHTAELVKYYQAIFPRITYFRWDSNMGADRNYLKVISLAQGEYCWFLGSDDNLKPGALKRMLKENEEGYDIYLCNRTECDFELNPQKDACWLSKEVNDQLFSLFDNDSLIDYFSRCRSIGAVFSYLSSIVFKRERWNNIKYDERFTGTAYSHVFMLLSFMKNGCTLRYIKEPLVLCRMDNDSFNDKNPVRRIMLDFEGYKQLSDQFFEYAPKVRKRFLKILTYQHRWRCIAGIRIRVSLQEWKDVCRTLDHFGYNCAILRLFNYVKPIILAFRYLSTIVK